jgi:hypothetical protein
MSKSAARVGLDVAETSDVKLNHLNRKAEMAVWVCPEAVRVEEPMANGAAAPPAVNASLVTAATMATVAFSAAPAQGKAAKVRWPTLSNMGYAPPNSGKGG